MIKWGPLRMIASLALGAVTLALSASAAEADVTVAVSPSLQEFAVDPGARFTQLIQRLNIRQLAFQPIQTNFNFDQFSGNILKCHFFGFLGFLGFCLYPCIDFFAPLGMSFLLI